MVLEASSFLTPWTIFIGALIVVVTAIIVLTLVERGLSRRINEKKVEEETYFQRRAGSLKSMNGDTKLLLNSIDGLAREFFADRFGVNRNAEYSELFLEFQKMGRKDIVDFCENIQEALYSGEIVSEKKLQPLIGELEFLIRDEAKERAEKDAQKSKIGFLGKEIDVTKMIQKKKVEQPTIYFVGDGKNKIHEISNEKKPIQMYPDKSVNMKNMKYEKEFTNINKLGETKPKEIKFVPFKEEKIILAKTKSSEPFDYRHLKSMDNLERVKKKIEARNKNFAFGRSGLS